MSSVNGAHPGGADPAVARPSRSVAILTISPRLWINGAVWLVLLTAALWLPLIGGYMELASRVLIYGLAAMGLNLLLGFTGCMSFGEAAYFGLGGYGTGLVMTYLTKSTVLAVLAGTAVGGLAAFVIGPLVMSRRGIYFAMITVAVGQIFYFIAERWNSFTGGEDGLSSFSRQPLHLGSLTIQLTAVPFYYFVLFFFAVGAGIIALLLHSPLGHTFVAIRENRRRALFLGVRIERYVWASFAIAGTLAALAGALNALEQNFISPISLYWVESGNLVIMAVLGGMRSFWGPLLGAIIFIGIQDYVSSFFPNNWESFIGALFIVAVVFFPNGILGIVRRRRRAS